MAEKIIGALVDGGKATAGPPLGPALGPLGINIQKILEEINAKTKAFEGTKVPVKVIVDPTTKKFRVEVGTPPVSALIKKELFLEKASQQSKHEPVADIAIDQLIKIAHAKKDIIHARTMKKAVKEIAGACVTMGILIEGKSAKDAVKDIEAGLYDKKIDGKEKLREIPREEIEEKKKKFATAIEEKRKAEEAAKAAAEAAKVAAAGAAAPGAAPAEGAETPKGKTGETAGAKPTETGKETAKKEEKKK